MANNQHYDVGIYGLWYGNNYGSMVTYYALSKIMEKMGKTYAMLRNPLGREIDVNTLRRSHPLRFGFAHYHITPLYRLNQMEQHNENFDSFLLGSDQMWNYYLSKPYRQSYYLDFADNTKNKVAYATSFGQEKFLGPEEEKPIIRNNLKRFNAISVRDDFSQRICKQDFDVKADLVMDPVFLCDVESYRELIKEAEILPEGEYIFAYVLDPNPEFGQVLNRAAEESEKKVLVVFNEDDNKEQCRQALGELSPQVNIIAEPTLPEWLALFERSSFVLTDSFHGSCFSIIFQKPFVALRNNKRGGARFPYLLGLAGLLSYLVTSPEKMLEKFLSLGIDHQINYDSVAACLAPELTRSRQWLERALNPHQQSSPETDIPEIGISMPEKLNDTDLENCRIVASLLKQYGIQDVVLSSGTRHLQLVKFFEANPCFRIYPVLDERSAGFFAIGLATRLNRPVAMCCTSGTAASNYLTAVSEAFYQHVPLAVITADRYPGYLNQKEDQMVPQPDIYRGVTLRSVTLPTANDDLNPYISRRLVCDALISMTKGVKGPVHINVPLQNIKKRDSSVYQLNKDYHKIDYIDYRSPRDEWQKAAAKLLHARTLIVYGQNAPADEAFVNKLNQFASRFNCVIAREHISNIHCDKSVEMFNMLKYNNLSHDMIMEIKPNIIITLNAKTTTITRDLIKRYRYNVEHWDIHESGNVEDPYRKLKCIFACDPDYFFTRFLSITEDKPAGNSLYQAWKKHENTNDPVPENFGQKYAIYHVLKSLPKHSLLHLGNSNTIRMANAFSIDPSIQVYCNRGTNGIDGSVSSFMGQCAVSQGPCFLIVGDLSFFYDMNALWNKKLTGNIRILLCNNRGAGLLKHHSSQAITYQHNATARGWAESLGMRYLTADSTESFEKALPVFTDMLIPKAVFFEIFC